MKIFSKQLIRAKLLKKAYMILMAKNTLPTDRLKLKALYFECERIANDGITRKYAEIENMR